jgi:ABC-type bacteriocin/lantibiotic exporter with double-glycine peptidase domain
MYFRRFFQTLGLSILWVFPATGNDGFVKQLHAQGPPTPTLTCGVDCLYFCLIGLGTKVPSLADFEQSCEVSSGGMSVAKLRKVAQSMGVGATVVSTDLRGILAWSGPTILHVGESHFVACIPAHEGGHLIIFDSRAGLFECTSEFFQERYDWRGNAVLIGDSPVSNVM